MTGEPAPDTVTEAVAYLAGQGYTDELRIGDDGLLCTRVDGVLLTGEAVVDHLFRFEGPSDPADEAIVLGVRFPARGVKGVVVSAFGPTTDPEHAAVLAALAAPPGRPG